MADNRKPYTVTLNGVEYTFLLSPDDAKRYGDQAVEAKQEPKPANKARSAQNK